jgi:hypothetical protein
MSRSLLRVTPPDRRRRPGSHRTRPAVEGLEGRALLTQFAPLPSGGPAQIQPPPGTAFNLGASAHLTGITLTSLVKNAAGMVTGAAGTVTGDLAGHRLTTTITIAPDPASPPGGPAVLDFTVGAIHLAGSGVSVNSGPVTVGITAKNDWNNLVGIETGGYAALLGGTVAATTPGLLSRLNSELVKPVTFRPGTLATNLVGLANGAFHQAFVRIASPVVTGTTPGSTNVLNTTLAPTDLTLLDLNVHFDNHASGPIAVTITTTPGVASPLSTVLADLASQLLDGGTNTTAVRNDLDQVVADLASATLT